MTIALPEIGIDAAHWPPLSFRLHREVRLGRETGGIGIWSSRCAAGEMCSMLSRLMVLAVVGLSLALASCEVPVKWRDLFTASQPDRSRQ